MSNELEKSDKNNSFLSQIQNTFLGNITQGTYMAEIRRDQPTAILFLIDQSGSMSGNQKAQICAEAINGLLNEVINIATKDGGLRNYIDVGFIGYGAEKESIFLFQEGLFTLTELDNQKTRIEKKIFTKKVRNTEITEEKEVSIWIEPVAKGGTPMGSAFDKAFETLQKWINIHPNSFPPVVINISDGQPTDANDEKMLEKALKIKNLHTTDGKALLFNCHLGEANAISLIFPENRNELPANDKYAVLMYDMSSTLPAQFHKKIAQIKNQDISENAQIVAMGFNNQATDLLSLLEVGTKTQMTAITQK